MGVVPGTNDLHIDPDIRRASTLPASVYTDAAWFELQRERVFAKTWHVCADADRVKVPGQCLPVTLLEGVLDEPLVFTRDSTDVVRLLSNVCTHRGNLVCDGDKVQTVLRCRYHGRRFGLDGQFLGMPEFDGVEGFPSAADNLREVHWAAWAKLLFACLDPVQPLERFIAPLVERVGWMPVDRMVLDPSRSRDYLVQANWALYVDNYLEGFHIPFVHQSLVGALDYGRYRTELFDHSSLQVGVAGSEDDAFEPPVGTPDHGQRIAGYYFWFFPSTMLNVYPWGVSVNAIRPLGPERCRVSYLTYVWDASRLDRGAGAGLDRVEREDEAVVEGVQRGVRSRLYERGRYSPTRETGVHHFHRLLSKFLAG
jgi:choline monooxygenase